jgi:hypothetical protein
VRREKGEGRRTGLTSFRAKLGRQPLEKGEERREKDGAYKLPSQARKTAP